MADDRELSRPPTVGERFIDRAFRSSTMIASVLVILAVIMVIGEVARTAMPFIEANGTSLLRSSSYDVNRNQFGLLPSIWGTIYTSMLALMLATFFGVSAAIFLTEDFLPNRLRTIIREAIQLLAAIPSVIYGLWGIMVVIPLLRGPANWLHRHFDWIPFFSSEYSSFAVLPAVIVLAIMVLPTITSLTIEALSNVPTSLRAGAYALGATRWESIFKIILPTAITGIAGAVVLAFGRAVGETMALAMLVGNAGSSGVSFSILGPGSTLAALIANKFPEAGQMEKGALMVAGLMLLLITLLVNIIGEFIIWRSTRRLRGLRR